MIQNGRDTEQWTQDKLKLRRYYGWLFERIDAFQKYLVSADYVLDTQQDTRDTRKEVKKEKSHQVEENP